MHGYKYHDSIIIGMCTVHSAHARLGSTHRGRPSLQVALSSFSDGSTRRGQPSLQVALSFFNGGNKQYVSKHS
ncbi:Uncharacterized protein TCM_010008 [Theobroma cacao]|uniref:Uncharacterized protein n=1 Tax=Theobroma cacao TaxID=3641 RepID=A0A061E6I7_THECC|nr:Uncharacterized protein TCM_010008 [Theobroma cacao]